MCVLVKISRSKKKLDLGLKFYLPSAETLRYQPQLNGFNLMKNETKQELKSFGVLTVLGLLGFSVMVIAAPWKRFESNSNSEQALQKAEVVGYQVAQIFREATKPLSLSVSNPRSPGNRIPASTESKIEGIRSVGTISMDPWGQPYHYRILSFDKNRATKILVWSTGKNKISENPSFDDESSQIHVAVKPTFSGDDIGTLINVDHN